MNEIKLSEEHIAAINRRRRIILNYDAMCGQMPYLEGEELTESMFYTADLPDSAIDSIWWNWGDGNIAIWDSKILQRYTHARMPRWRREKYDPVGLCHNAAKKRGLESFFSYRINGSDADKWVDGHHQVEQVTFKKKHPEWLIYGPQTDKGWGAPLYNFAEEGVRDHKIAILREVFELYDYDGIEIDFARVCPVLPPGQAWLLRDQMTAFMLSLREMLQKQAAKRKHPILIAARVPETLVGCHFDGLNVEEWAARHIVDLLVLGVRSFEVESRAFGALFVNHGIKSYPCIDDIHATDEYRNPPMEVFRGVLTNWRNQGFEGFQTFNFQNSDPKVPTVTRKIDQHLMIQFTLHKRFYEEVGSGEIYSKKKTYVIQRRGGGHAMNIQSHPWDWRTPRRQYCNTNMEAQLPAKLKSDEHVDLLLYLYVGEVPAMSDLVIKLSENEDIEVRINGSGPLHGTMIKGGMQYHVDQERLAKGDNLIGVSLDKTDEDCDVWVTKVELREVRNDEYWETMYDD